MTQRHKRRPELFEQEKRQLLEALGACRKAIIDAGIRLNPRSPSYQLGTPVITAIDKLAAELSGDPKFFHARSGST